ncbi:MAG: hypothetical protein JOZ41_10320, partial [Chloroflexi bacterium]|nr:hypothetical protein [Chloroflexota bacterium]
MTALFPRSRLLRALVAAATSTAILVPAGGLTPFVQASTPAASAGTLTIGIQSAIET